MKLSFPKFQHRFPWWGSDLQTLRNNLISPRRRVDALPANGIAKIGRRLYFPLNDDSGDTLVGWLEEPPEYSKDKPLVVLLHGLGGNEESSYIETSATYFYQLGYRVLRFNLRGAGASRPLCRFQYHAGKSEDLHSALQVLMRDHSDLTKNGLFLIGFSLGGNMLLKFLAEYGSEFPVCGAASVSAPIDLQAATIRFMAKRNAVYQWHLLRNMKQECFAEGAEITEEEIAVVKQARSIYEYDQVFIAPRNGYSSAEDYYANNMALQFLEDIQQPTLLIHALDDPWIPKHAYINYAWGKTPQLYPLLSPGGGHVGFHGADSADTWHDRCIQHFMAAL